jgi:hypothetical protein
MTKDLGGRPEHVPTDESRLIVKELYAAGIQKLRIAERLGIAEKTLIKHYVLELEDNKENMIAALSKNLYQDALNGSQQAREFWLKCQARWSYAKPPEEDKKSLSDELLARLIDKL